MPITVFEIRGIPGHRRERVEAAVVAGGKHLAGPHGFKVLITGPHGFEWAVAFALDDNPAVIAASGPSGHRGAPRGC
jgi:hypothetical protein